MLNAAPLIEDMVSKLENAVALRHRLVLLVGPSGTGKTNILREVAKLSGVKPVNVNFELSRRLLGLTERRRPLRVQRLLQEIIEETASDTVFLDNVELLFDISLSQDPLRLLQDLSRNRTLAVTWNGSIEDGHVCYAAPWHQEYRRYPLEGALVVSVGATVT